MRRSRSDRQNGKIVIDKVYNLILGKMKLEKLF